MDFNFGRSGRLPTWRKLFNNGNGEPINAPSQWRFATRLNSTVSMKHSLSGISDLLHAIYSKHRRRHCENPDSKQMCCMWSTDDPPEIIEGTEPICDIEDAFGIQISDGEALEIYDMYLDQAARKIREIEQGKPKQIVQPCPLRGLADD